MKGSAAVSTYGNTVGLAGLHRRQRGGVIAPRVGVARAGVAIRRRRHEGRFLPFAVLLQRPAPHAPLRSRDQRRQCRRQLCQVPLVRGRFPVLHDYPCTRMEAVSWLRQLAASVALRQNGMSSLISLLGDFTGWSGSISGSAI